MKGVRIALPNPVKRIISTLNKAGFEASAVGGCVRDSLLKREPQDWDITTNARPEEVKQLFRRTVDTGIQHGTVTVMVGKEGYEVTTYRIDGVYTDARHPEQVTFAGAIREDLLRRDFTINAMAYNSKDGLIDIFSGREDLDKKVIRAVGVPSQRFSEDALRIMRCVRFSAQLGFTIDERTFEAARALSGNLQKISRERIRDELMKTLMSDHPSLVSRFEDIGAMPYIFPDFTAYKAERLKKLEKADKDRLLRLACFLYKEPPLRAEALLKDLRFDNDTVTRTVKLLSSCMTGIRPDDRFLRHLMASFGEDDVERLLKFTGNEALVPAVRIIKERGDCVSLKTLALTGNDLIALGLKPGPELGKILNSLLKKVLDDPSLNTKEHLTALFLEKNS